MCVRERETLQEQMQRPAAVTAVRGRRCPSLVVVARRAVKPLSWEQRHPRWWGVAAAQPAL